VCVCVLNVRLYRPFEWACERKPPFEWTCALKTTLLSDLRASSFTRN